MRILFLLLLTLSTYTGVWAEGEQPITAQATTEQALTGQKLIFHTEYERMTYVAEKLGLLRLPSSPVEFEWQQIVASYKIPLSICSGFLLRGLVGYTLFLFSSYDWIGKIQDTERCFVICILFSILVAYAILEFFQVQQSHLAGTFLRNLEAFLADWTFNKESVPLVLLPLFQEMYELYLMYGRKLPLHSVMVEELRRIVVYYWLRGIAELDAAGQNVVAVDVCVDKDSPVTVQTHGYATTTVR